ncbi:MAG: ABC transporter substrate-binding protein [Dehalococcoidia bacterium]|nr:ABC transporter substrate-binding protein [Dehalococcoidia bacterium]
MRSSRWCLLFLVLGLIFSLACSNTVAQPAGVVVDDSGRVVNIAGIPQRIISLSPSNTEILFALGLGDKVVGVTDYCNYPSGALSKARIGGYSTPDIERIIALRPDLILADSIHAEEVIPALEAKGLTVFTLAPESLGGILEDIVMVGKVTGSEKEATEVVTQMENRIEAVTNITQDVAERPGVFFVTWHDPLWSVGSGTIIQELMEKAGGVNLFSDISGHGAVDLELVVARNPRVIITCTGHGEAEGKPFEWAMSEPWLQVTEARKNNRIYQLDADLVNREGPRVVDALEWFAYFIHPEVFDEPGR